MPEPHLGRERAEAAWASPHRRAQRDDQEWAAVEQYELQSLPGAGASCGALPERPLHRNHRAQREQELAEVPARAREVREPAKPGAEQVSLRLLRPQGDPAAVRQAFLSCVAHQHAR